VSTLYRPIYLWSYEIAIHIGLRLIVTALKMVHYWLSVNGP